MNRSSTVRRQRWCRVVSRALLGLWGLWPSPPSGHLERAQQPMLSRPLAAADLECEGGVGLGTGSVQALGVGEEDSERGAAAGAVLDPGAAAVQAGELGDQRQADARAGGVVGDIAARVEGREDLLAK